jgi:hypothetical protein
MLMRLLGANCPKTAAGTIVGNPTAAAAPSPVFKKLRRETPRESSFVFIDALSEHSTVLQSVYILEIDRANSAIR